MSKEKSVAKGFKQGQKVANFTLVDDQNKPFTLYDHLESKNIILYFYPKDDTPGCTKEACYFRDEFEVFKALDALVIGISNDDAASHRRFKEKYQLPFTLLCDEKNEVRNLFGVTKDFFGLLSGRVTYIIDKHGILRYRFSSHINIKKHVDEAIRVLKELN